MATDVELGKIETEVPARLDRLPWSRFHWMVLFGLGTVWILDGLEVTIVGSVASRLTDADSGVGLSAGDIGLAAAIYIAGACLGALFFGQLTDRLGRKKLFVLTLAVYITATVATAFSFAPWYFFLCRFFTGSGIGGEYAAINSAIDELIPARVRGRVDLIINGTYWLGAAAGAGAAVLLLDKDLFAPDLGWRLAFGLGAVLGLTIMLVRRHVPESPRWLFIHGQEEEAERIVGEIEDDVRRQTGERLTDPDSSLTVRQRKAIPFREIAKVAFTAYPGRAMLGFALFVGQAFIYNGVTFNLGTMLGTFYGVASGIVPAFIVIYAIGNFLGPVTLGRLFDTVGRKPMITLSYVGSAVAGVVLGLAFISGAGGLWLFMILLVLTFFLASAGASAAYLTVSEIFPMENRALAIAFFYAIGTAVGGISGPLLFGQLIGSGDRSTASIAIFIGCAVMALGGLAELVFGVKAEGANLEDIAKPLTADEADSTGSDQDAATQDASEQDKAGDERDGSAAEQRDGGLDLSRRQFEQRTESRRRRREQERTGRGRYRPGPGGALYSPWMSISLQSPDDAQLDAEIDRIEQAVRDRGALRRSGIASVIGARYWGPGRFRTALREALAEQRLVVDEHGTFRPGPADPYPEEDQRQERRQEAGAHRDPASHGQRSA